MARPSTGTSDLAELFDRLGAELERFATVLVGRDLAQDVVAGVFARAVAKPTWRRARNERAYLYQMVANEARDLQRSASARERREAADALEREFVSVPDAESSVDVRRELARLSPRQRVSTFLYYWNDWTEEEIAGVLGISAGSVRQHLARARARLRTVL